MTKQDSSPPSPTSDFNWKSGEGMTNAGLGGLWLGAAAMLLGWLLPPAAVGESRFGLLLFAMAVMIVGAICYAAGKVVIAIRKSAGD